MRLMAYLRFMLRTQGENLLLAILIVAAIAFLSAGLLLMVIVAIRRRGQKEEEEVLPPLEIPPSPAAPAPTLLRKKAERRRATAWSAPEQAGTVLASGAPPSPTAMAERLSPFSAPSPPDFAGKGPQPPFVGPEPQPPLAGATHIIKRRPRTSVVGLLVDRQHPERRFDIAKPTITIGRARSCDVAIDHTTVSRQHAAIKLEEGRFRLYDLGSTNGTFLGEQRVREPAVLEDGATVRFGEIEFIFKVGSLDTQPGTESTSTQIIGGRI